MHLEWVQSNTQTLRTSTNPRFRHISVEKYFARELRVCWSHAHCLPIHLLNRLHIYPCSEQRRIFKETKSESDHKLAILANNDRVMPLHKTLSLVLVNARVSFGRGRQYGMRSILMAPIQVSLFRKRLPLLETHLWRKMTSSRCSPLFTPPIQSMFCSLFPRALDWTRSSRS